MFFLVRLLQITWWLENGPCRTGTSSAGSATWKRFPFTFTFPHQKVFLYKKHLPAEEECPQWIHKGARQKCQRVSEETNNQKLLDSFFFFCQVPLETPPRLLLWSSTHMAVQTKTMRLSCIFKTLEKWRETPWNKNIRGRGRLLVKHFFWSYFDMSGTNARRANPWSPFSTLIKRA